MTDTTSIGTTRKSIPNTLEALDALPDGAKLVSRHGDTLTLEYGLLSPSWGNDAFSLPFARRYVLDENAETLEVEVPEVIDPRGCIVYVVGGADMSHYFPLGTAVEVRVDECLVDGTYECMDSNGYSQWISSVDLDLEPPALPVVPLLSTDSTYARGEKGLDALPSGSVIWAPEYPGSTAVLYKREDRWLDIAAVYDTGLPFDETPWARAGHHGFVVLHHASPRAV